MLTRSQTSQIQPRVHFIRGSTLSATTENARIQTGAAITREVHFAPLFGRAPTGVDRRYIKRANATRESSFGNSFAAFTSSAPISSSVFQSALAIFFLPFNQTVQRISEQTIFNERVEFFRYLFEIPRTGNGTILEVFRQSGNFFAAHVE